MNDWEKLYRQAQHCKEAYPVGTRILLIDMNDPYAPVPSGTRGTVKAVDDIGQIHMEWDNHRTLALVPGEDSFRKLTPQELIEEQHSSKQGKVDDLISSAEQAKAEHSSGSTDKNNDVVRNDR